MSRPGFDLETAQREAAGELPPEIVGDFRRLVRSLVFGPAFQWLLIDAPEEGLNRSIRSALDRILRAAGLRISLFPLSSRIADVAALESRLVEHASRSDVVHVLAQRDWFDRSRWDAFNARRERIASHARARIVFWLDSRAIEDIVEHAPDLWAWRAGVYTFRSGRSVEPFASGGRVASSLADRERLLGLRSGASLAPVPTDTRTIEQQRARISEIRDLLSQRPPLHDDLKASALSELGVLLRAVGDDDAALAHWRDTALPFLHTVGDARAIANALANIAVLTADRGDLREAENLFRDSVVPAFEALDDPGEVADAWNSVAVLADLQGRSDEAHDVRSRHVMPIRERLGNKRALVAVLIESVGYLIERNRLDEALATLTNRLLPMAMELGDPREVAMAQRLLGEIKMASGQYDEALRLLSDQLPVWQRLGDNAMRAVIQSRMAQVLELRGQGSEALRLRRDEVLPAFEREGRALLAAVTIVQMAPEMTRQGAAGEAVRMLKDEAMPPLLAGAPSVERISARAALASALGRDTARTRAEAREQLTAALDEARTLAPHLVPPLEHLVSWIDHGAAADAAQDG